MRVLDWTLVALVGALAVTGAYLAGTWRRLALAERERRVKAERAAVGAKPKSMTVEVKVDPAQIRELVEKRIAEVVRRQNEAPSRLRATGGGSGGGQPTPGVSGYGGQGAKQASR